MLLDRNNRMLQKMESLPALVEGLGQLPVQARKTAMPFLQGLASPLVSGGRESRAASLLGQVLSNFQFQEKLKEINRPPFLDVHPAHATFFGFQHSTGLPVGLNRENVRHLFLINGATGMGKSTLEASINSQLLQQGIAVDGIDLKGGEAARVALQVPDSIVFRPDQWPFNDLDSEKADPTLYLPALLHDFGRAATSFTTTKSEATDLLLAINRALKNEDPRPSWKDFQKILELKGKQRNRETMFTFARAIQALRAVRKRSGHLRKGPNIDDKFKFRGWDFSGCPPKLARFLISSLVLRAQFQAMAEGHSESLKRVFSVDEGLLLVAQEMSSGSSDEIPIATRLATQLRAFGIGVILCTQSLKVLDHLFKANAGCFITFRTTSVDDARESCEMLGLDWRKGGLQEVMNLNVGECYIRALTWPSPVKVIVPPLDLGPYPSDSQLETKFKPHHDWISKNSTYSPHEDKDYGIDYLEILGERRHSPRHEPESSSETEEPSRPSKAEPEAKPGKKPQQALNADYILLLTAIQAWEAFDKSVSDYSKIVCWSSGKTQKVYRILVENGLIEIREMPGATGRPKKVLKLTGKGKEFLHA